MTTPRLSVESLIATTGSPELALLAALVRDSIESCRAGDRSACLWLRRCAPRWLRLLADDPDGLHQRVLALIQDRSAVPASGAPAGSRSTSAASTAADHTTAAVQLPLWRQ